MKKQIITLIVTLLIPLLSVNVFAGDDPSIQGQLRTDIGKAMQRFIAQNSVDNRFIIYDAVSGELMLLEFEKLHAGIVKKGNFYVSCADFMDGKGNKYDLDFLVGDTGTELTTLEAIVHSINGKKRVYHLENK